MPSNTLPLWTDLCKPVDEILGKGIPEQSWAADFGEMLEGRAADIYTDPVRFFDLTYITSNMREIFVNVLNAMTGGTGQRILEIDTPFGGGKTHCIIALYHLIKHAAILKNHPKVRDIYQETGFSETKQVKLATIVGTALNPLGTLHDGDGVTTKSLLGEIIYQLDSSLYPRIRGNDEKWLCPGTNDLGKLFEQIGPCVILIDELLEFVSKQMAGFDVKSVKAFMLSFLQELFTVVANSANAVLVTTYPKGGPQRDESPDEDDQQRDQVFHTEAENVQAELTQFIASKQEVENRHHMTTLVAAGGEDVANILKARLFKRVPVPEDENVVAIADSFWTFYSLNQDHFPTPASTPEYLEKLKKCFPFHPELLRILYDQWSTLPKFQKTRAFMKLIAEIIRFGYRATKDPSAHPLTSRSLILPGAIDLADTKIRAILLKCLDQDYKPVLEEDLGRAKRIDEHKLGRMQAERYAYAMTTAIFMHSFTGAMSQDSARQFVASRGAYQPDILFAVVAPHIRVSNTQGDGDLPPIGQIQDMITQLTTHTESLYYLHCNAQRQFFFNIRTNLVAFADAQRRLVREKDVINEVKESVEKLWMGSTGNPNMKIIIFPEEPMHIPDTSEKPHLKLILMSPEIFTFTEGIKNLDAIQKFALYANVGRGTTGMIQRQFKNLIFFLVAETDAWNNCKQAQRNNIAWDITLKSPQFGEANQYEQDQANKNLQRAEDVVNSYLRILFTKLFRYMKTGDFALDPDFNLPHLLQRSQDHPFLIFVDWLKQNQVIFTQLKPAILMNHFREAWGEQENEVSLAIIWERFAQNTKLPRLESTDILFKCAEEGIQAGYFTVGVRKPEEKAYSKIFASTKAPEIQNLTDYWLIRDASTIRIACKSCHAEVFPDELVEGICPKCQKIRCWRCGANVKRSDIDEKLGCSKCRDKEQCQNCQKFWKPEDILREIGKCTHCQGKVECPGCKQFREESELRPAKSPTHCTACQSWKACKRCGKRISLEDYEQEGNVIHYCSTCLQETAQKCNTCGAKQELFNLRPIPEDGNYQTATFRHCVSCEDRQRCTQCNKWTATTDLQGGLCPTCLRESQMEERVVKVEMSFEFTDIFTFQSQINAIAEKLGQFPGINSKGQCQITFEESRSHPFPWNTEEDAKKAFTGGVPSGTRGKIDVNKVEIKKMPKTNSGD